MNLVILTQSPQPSLFSKETYKNFIRNILGKTRGPQGVTGSVVRGLKGMGMPFFLNPDLSVINAADVIWVNESVDALKWAIAYRKKDIHVKLVVGPNLVVLPNDFNSIMFDEAIDKIIQPSEWTRDFYLSYKPELKSKIKIWAAGVLNPSDDNLPRKDNYVVVYQKNAPQELLLKVVKSLEYHLVPYQIINYGHFNQKGYFKTVGRAIGMVYLSTSESQGLALQEAWIRDTPTLVWDRGYWEVKNNRFEAKQVSCPYLTPETGMTFLGEKDIDVKCEEFIKKLSYFKARAYSLEHFTDEITTKKFLDIISPKYKDNQI